MTVSVTGSENMSPEEKPVLNPELVLLTQSLREWKAPVCSDLSTEAGIEESYRMSLKSVSRPITMEYPSVKPMEVSPPPGLSEVTRLSWTIEKASVLLKSGDHIKISPSMEVSLGEGRAPAKFKLMMKPKTSTTANRGRGGDCFRKAKGHCFIELKCEEGQDVIGNTQFSIWVGDQPPQGPVQHNFSNEIVGRLSRDKEMWDMKKLLGQVPENPETWDLKTPIAEGCLVLGVEISVFLKSKPSMSVSANSNTESDNTFVTVSDSYPIRLSL